MKILGKSFFEKGNDTKALVMGVISLACETKTELSIIILGKTDKNRSMFIGLSPTEKSVFYIDIFGSKAEQSSLEPGKTKFSNNFEISTIQYSFTSTFLAIEKFEGFDSLKIQAPPKIFSEQRREFYRVDPRLSEPVVITLEDKSTFTALNISGGGLCFRNDKPIPLGTGMKVKIKLPTVDEQIESELEVVRIDMDPITGRSKYMAAGRYKIRCRYNGMLNREIQIIQRYIITYQRENLKLQR